MPTYDYACAACGHRFEVVHGVHGHGPEACPNCGKGPVRKAFAAPTVLFKGSGWAKMDRRSSSKPAATESTTAGDSSSDSSGKGSDSSTTGSDSSGKSSDAGGTGSDSTSTKARPSTDSGSAPAAAAPD